LFQPDIVGMPKSINEEVMQDSALQQKRTAIGFNPIGITPAQAGDVFRIRSLEVGQYGEDTGPFDQLRQPRPHCST
jgi:hypothetical protein